MSNAVLAFLSYPSTFLCKTDCEVRVSEYEYLLVTYTNYISGIS
jgi:hypothetical protein